MDGNPPQEKKNLKNLPFWEIGLVEFGFVAVVLILLFGILNYFNILSLSDTFPKQFSWLPRHIKPTPPQLFSKVLTPSPAGFQYDIKKAEKLITQYIKDNIKPEFLPSKIEVNQGQQIDGKNSNSPYEFGWRFTDKSGTVFSTTLHYAEKTNNIVDQDVLVILTGTIVPEKIANADLSNLLINKYLLNGARPILPSDCPSAISSSYCQVFNVDPDGKRGYGLLISGAQTSTPFKTLFSCFIAKENPDYDKRSSCITPQ